MEKIEIFPGIFLFQRENRSAEVMFLDLILEKFPQKTGIKNCSALSLASKNQP